MGLPRLYGLCPAKSLVGLTWGCAEKGVNPVAVWPWQLCCSARCIPSGSRSRKVQPSGKPFPEG